MKRPIRVLTALIAVTLGFGGVIVDGGVVHANPATDIYQTQPAGNMGCTYQATAAVHHALPPTRIVAYATTTCKGTSFASSICMSVSLQGWDKVIYPDQIWCDLGVHVPVSPLLSFVCRPGRLYTLEIQFSDYNNWFNHRQKTNILCDARWEHTGSSATR